MRSGSGSHQVFTAVAVLCVVVGLFVCLVVSLVVCELLSWILVCVCVAPSEATVC